MALKTHDVQTYTFIDVCTLPWGHAAHDTVSYIYTGSLCFVMVLELQIRHSLCFCLFFFLHSYCIYLYPITVLDDHTKHGWGFNDVADEVGISASNRCEPKPQASDWSKHIVSDILLCTMIFMMSLKAGIRDMVMSGTLLWPKKPNAV